MAATIIAHSANAVVRPTARARSSAVRASAAPKVAKPAVPSLTRRDAVLLGSSALQMLVASKAWALIPGNDDEDEELLAKAKARRTEKIQAERALEKNYVTKNDLKLDADTSKVQVAVYKLSKAGGLIESGYLALAAEELGKGSWDTELKGAGSKLGKEPDAFLDEIAKLRKACLSGDASKSKSAYVAAANALESYAKQTKTADNLKLL